ncbi:hypothetical protein [Rhizobium multihospitium]|uniref:Uncharacterized protein n=1 Tax=Rhizobium multihospitium TaxID=410764 RepID=A0A1C3WPR2_9HYPH|nr:hypothetical protein [Rhizobium multihospitium]SCB41704.1 hypothetical protein GA0061103_5904 [Rhizobium multihospitium]
MNLNRLILGALLTCAVATGALAQSTSVSINNLPTRALSYMVGHDSSGLAGREPVTDFLKPGSTLPVNGNIACWGTSANLIADCGKSLPSGAIVGTTDTQTLPNKTLPSPVITGGANFSGSTSGATVLQASSTASGTITIPSGTDTLLTANGAATVTNKSIDASQINSGIIGSAVSVRPNNIAPSSVANTSATVNVSSQPTYSFPENLATEFNGDFSKTFLPLTYNVTGAGTMGNGTYYWSPAVTPFQSLINFSSGANGSTTTNSQRTGFSTYRTMINHNGQGDAGGYYTFCQITNTRAGATNFLASPACVGMFGDFGATTDGGYLQGVGDLNFSDGGHDVAAIGDVRNFIRTNNTAALGEVWMGYRGQSSGSKNVDVFLSGSGGYNVGLDTTQMTGLQSALNMASGQTINFNSTASAIDGINWYGNNYGTSTLGYSTTVSPVNPNSGAIVTSFGGTPTFAVDGTGAHLQGSLTTVSTASFAPQNSLANQANDANAAYIQLKKSRGASGAGSAVHVGDTLGTVLFQGADSNGTIQNSANITATVTSVSAGAVDSSMALSVPGATPITINSSGTVFQGSITAGSSVGVSCSVGSVNVSTMVVVNGIVTHC